MAALRRANARALRTSLIRASRMYSAAMSFQCPGGVYVPAPSFQRRAIASCSRVRLSTACFTSASSWRICSDDVDGGGPGRAARTSAGVIIQVRTRPKFGSIGGRAGDSWLLQGTSPCAIAESVSACQSAGLPPAVRMPSFAARAMNAVATALPNATPAAMSLADALPDHSAALRCSAALSVISSTAAGNNALSSSTVTPDSTASSEGYAGRSVIGTSAWTALSTLAGDARLNWYFQNHAALSASYCAALT